MGIKAEEDFIKLLHTLLKLGGYGFPIGSILLNYKILDNLRSDIVIDIDKPLGIIEVKKGKFDLIGFTKQLRKYYNSIDDKNIELFLVYFGSIKEPNEITFYQYDKKNDKLEEIKSFPNYEYFLNKNKKEVKAKLFNYIDDHMCLILLGGISLIVFGLISIFCNILISMPQFFVILLGVGIILLPFFTKIKFGGLEFEINNK